MKICYISDAGSVHTIKWCDFFAERGYSISVISLRHADIPNATVYGFEEKDFTQSDLSKLKYLTYTNRVKQILREVQPDIIHAHYITSYGALAALSGFHPCVMTVWGTDVQEFPKKSWAHRKLVEFNLKRADAIWTVSHALKNLTCPYTDKPIEVTPFGVNIDEFRPIPELKQGEEYVIGTVKALEPRYGIETMIEAFALIKKRHNMEHLKLEIAGIGSLKNDLIALSERLGVGDDVRFLGFLTKQGVIEAFNRFKIAIFPSIEEGFGVAAVEAQACGTPAVVSNIGGLPESTLPGETSILANVKDPESFANAIESLLFDEEKRRSMEIRAREFVVENYDIRDNFAYADTLYRELYRKHYGREPQ